MKRVVVLLCLASAAAGAFADAFAADQVKFSSAAQAVDVAVSRFGTFTAVADTTEGNSIRVLDANWELLWRHRQPVYYGGTFRHAPILQFAPDESFLVAPAFRTDTDIALLDPKTGNALSVLTGHSGTVDCLAVSPDASWMVSSSGQELFLWKRQGASFVLSDRFAGHTGAAQSLAFSPDGAVVASGETDDMTRRLVLYAVGSGKLAAVSRYENPENNLGHEYTQLAFSPDGRWLAAGYSDSLRIFERTASGIRLAQTVSGIELGPVISVTFSPDGALVATGHVRDVRVWQADAGTWTEAATFTPHLGHVNALRFSMDGTRLAIAGGADTNALGLWSVHGVGGSPTGKLYALLGGRLSRAQRRFLGDELAAQILAALAPEDVAPRDMFETEQEYGARQARAAAQAASGLQEETERRFGATRQQLPGALYAVDVPLQDRGTYAIDAHSYTLRFMETDAIARLERDPARELYQNWQKARVRATRIRTDAGTTYDDFRLILPTSRVEVPLGLSENPFTGESLDRYGTRVPSVMVGPDLLVRGLTMEGVFPALYHFYADHGLGTMTVQNTGSGTITDLSVRLFVPGLMKTPTDVSSTPALGVGQSQETALRALFDPAALDRSDGGTASAEITLQYTSGGKQYQDTIRRPLGLLNRNALRWTDDRKVGAFMTVSSPAFLRFSGQVAGAADDVPTGVLTRNLLAAARMFEALQAAGVRYVVDPASPYESLSRDRDAIDYIRFPLETLDARSGDCDDLSVLYTSLLESVGVDSAFITTPGHIFSAFSLGMSAEAAAKSFGADGGFISRDGAAWLPVETTMIGDGFTKAWQTAASEWRDAQAAGTGSFFTAREAWALYLPAGFAGAPSAAVPAADRVSGLLSAEMDGMRAAWLAPREKEILDSLARGASPERQNQLGILYAQFGLLSKALERFTAADDYVPALVNAANVFSLRKDPGQAQEYLKRAQAAQPDNPRVLVALAFSFLQSGNEAEARRTWDQVSRLDPDLSARYPLAGAAAVATGAGPATGQARAGRVDPSAQLFGTDWVP